MRSLYSCNQAMLRRAYRKARRTIRYFRRRCPRFSVPKEDLRVAVFTHCLRGIKVSALVEWHAVKACGSSIVPQARRNPGLGVSRLGAILHEVEARLEFYDKYHPNQVIPTA
jgi:hypothetical protein